MSDGFTVTTTDAQGVYQMRVKKSTPFVFVSVPADCEIPVENGMPKIYKKIALGDNDVVQRSFTLERTGKKERFTLLALAALWGGEAIWFAPVISEAVCLAMALAFMVRFWKSNRTLAAA